MPIPASSHCVPFATATYQINFCLIRIVNKVARCVNYITTTGQPSRTNMLMSCCGSFLQTDDAKLKWKQRTYKSWPRCFASAMTIWQTSMMYIICFVMYGGGPRPQNTHSNGKSAVRAKPYSAIYTPMIIPVRLTPFHEFADYITNNIRIPEYQMSDKICAGKSDVYCCRIWKRVKFSSV